MKKKIIAFLLAAGALAAPGCNQYLDVNVDPFLPQEAPPDQFLPQIVYALGEGPMFDVRFVGRYVQHWQWTTVNENYDRHGRRGLGGGLAGSQTHRNHYWAIGSNLNQMEQQAAQRGFNRYAGIATAMRAYSWQISTDLFGEMPYQQAWDNSRTKFDYDPQKFIYEQVDKLCDEAIAKLADETGSLDPLLARAETIYGGDPQKWTRFMYGIKARLANHVSNKRSYNPQRVIQLVDQALRSNDDDARTPFTAELGRNADFYSFMGPLRNNFVSMRQGTTIVNLLRGQFTNNVPDPRLNLLFNPAPSDLQVRGLDPTRGIPTGQTANFPLMYGKGIFRDTEPYPLLTYAELQFVKAEAALRLGNQTLAFAAFQNGVRAHLTRLGVPAADQASFLANGLPATAAALELRHVMSQKYIALYGQIEVWSDLRRHNYNGQIFMGYTLPTNLAAENNGKPVQRLLPPSFSEEDWNSAAFRAIGGYDLDYHTKPVWFASTEE
jgi:Starch-binding associating with outer membrane